MLCLSSLPNPILSYHPFRAFFEQPHMFLTDVPTVVTMLPGGKPNFRQIIYVN